MSSNVRISQPQDRSLESFKAWVRATVKALGGPAEDDTTEAEWRADWQAFWQRVDKTAR